jgi:hypothetical protein
MELGVQPKTLREHSLRKTICSLPKPVVKIIAEYGTTDYHDVLLMMLKQASIIIMTYDIIDGKPIDVTTIFTLINIPNNIAVRIRHGGYYHNAYSIDCIIEWMRAGRGIDFKPIDPKLKRITSDIRDQFKSKLELTRVRMKTF